MTLRLNGSTSGYTEIDAPAVAGNNTLVLPTGNGTNGQFLQGNGSGTLSWSGSLTLGTAQASTSGTAIDFTGIPSWVKRVTVMFNGVSTNGTSHYLVQIGSGSVTSTSYSSTGLNFNTTPTIVSATSTAGFVIVAGGGVVAMSGHLLLTAAPGVSNGWLASGTFIRTDSAVANISGGVSPTLSGTLDRVRITTVNGTDTFDAGSINILYEG